MDTAEIVIRKMQIHSSPKILQFPRKGVRQSRESAKLHSYGQVLPFHKTSGDVLGIGVTAADFGYNLRDLSWGVSLISVLAIVSVELRKLCEVRISCERFFDGLAVEDVGISGQLDAMVSDPTPEVAHEGLGVLAGSFADQTRVSNTVLRHYRPPLLCHHRYCSSPANFPARKRWPVFSSIPSLTIAMNGSILDRKSVV